MQTVSLEVAKALRELGVKGETEKRYIDTLAQYPAYNLQELLTILPQIGEKLGWDGIHVKDASKNVTVPCKEGSVTYFDDSDLYWAHILLERYLTGKMPAVNEELIKLLGKK